MSAEIKTVVCKDFEIYILIPMNIAKKKDKI